MDFFDNAEGDAQQPTEIKAPATKVIQSQEPRFNQIPEGFFENKEKESKVRQVEETIDLK
jgi:hypothetical protein